MDRPRTPPSGPAAVSVGAGAAERGREAAAIAAAPRGAGWALAFALDGANEQERRYRHLLHRRPGRGSVAVHRAGLPLDCGDELRQLARNKDFEHVHVSDRREFPRGGGGAWDSSLCVPPVQRSAERRGRPLLP